LILGIRAYFLEWFVNKITYPYLLELLTFAASRCKNIYAFFDLYLVLGSAASAMLVKVSAQVAWLTLTEGP
jgi:hypothetical protein